MPDIQIYVSCYTQILLNETQYIWISETIFT